MTDPRRAREQFIKESRKRLIEHWSCPVNLADIAHMMMFDAMTFADNTRATPPPAREGVGEFIEQLVQAHKAKLSNYTYATVEGCLRDFAKAILDYTDNTPPRGRVVDGKENNNAT